MTRCFSAVAELLVIFLFHKISKKYICCKQELEEKDNEIEFYKDQERVYQEEILAYKKVEASTTQDVVVITVYSTLCCLQNDIFSVRNNSGNSLR